MSTSHAAPEPGVPDGPGPLEQATDVQIGRTQLRVVVRAGEPGRPPLLLCNGIGAPHEVFEPFVKALDPRITAIRFDVPGVGASPPLPVPVPYGVLAALAARLVRKLGHDRFDVLGISWGGGLAQEIAFQYPRRCRRLVLAATATGWMMVPASPGVLRRLMTPARYRDPGYIRAVAGSIYGGAVRRQPELAKALVAADRPPSLRGYANQLWAGAGWASLPFLPLIRQRTLILAGTDDPIIPVVNARMMAALLPHAELHTYDDGHLALVTDCEHLGPRVSEFLLAD